MAAAAGYKRSCDPQSEASFLKKRRSDVAAGSSIVTAEEAWQVKHDMQVGQDLWEQSHAKECKFLEEKTKRRLAQAVAENAVAWESLDEQKQQWCIECWQKEEKQIRDGFKKNLGASLLRPTLPSVAGCPVWLHPDVVKRGNVKILSRHAAKMGIRVVESSYTAKVHVWPSVEPPSQSILWQACLDGKIVLDQVCLETDGARGASVCYKATIETQRLLFLTPKFCERHETLAHD